MRNKTVQMSIASPVRDNSDVDPSDSIFYYSAA